MTGRAGPRLPTQGYTRYSPGLYSTPIVVRKTKKNLDWPNFIEQFEIRVALGQQREDYALLLQP